MRVLPFLIPMLLLAGVAAYGSPEEEAVTPEAPTVRVRLSSLGSPSQVVVRGTNLRVTDGSGEALPVEGGSVTLVASGNRVKVGTAAAETVRVQGDLLKVQSGRVTRDYPGTLVVSASRSGLGLMNECSLERYTEGVLAGECPSLFHPEAIRAMAISARSYSFRKAFMTGGELCDTVHCQVYRGATGIAASIREAARATEGLCALYQGEVIDAVYCSDCGGYTEANEAAWKGARPVPYLRPVEDAPEPQGTPYCAVNRGHRWALSVTKARLQSLLGRRAAGVSLEVVDTTDSGRVSRLRLHCGSEDADTATAEPAPKPAAKTFAGDQWRRLLGLSAVKSLKFEVRETASGIALEGRGFGHGVGLCQYGANGMGKSGASAESILKHYYTGIEVGPLPSVEEARARLPRRRMARSR